MRLTTIATLHRDPESKRSLFVTVVLNAALWSRGIQHLHEADYDCNFTTILALSQVFLPPNTPREFHQCNSFFSSGTECIFPMVHGGYKLITPISINGSYPRKSPHID